MQYRSNAQKYIVLLTDGNYSTWDISGDIKNIIDGFIGAEIVVSVITSEESIPLYEELVNETGGVHATITTQYENELVELNQIITGNTGFWIRLADATWAFLEADPTLGDGTVDTDEDGIPDIFELQSEYEIVVTNQETGKNESIKVWSYYSNPSIMDTDGDTLTDFEDLLPTLYDVVVVSEDENSIVFNTGRTWYNISCTSYDYLDNVTQFVDNDVDNPIPLEELRTVIQNVEKNKEQSFCIDELCYIGIYNNEGSKIYMQQMSKETREEVFQKITGRESKYYKHSSILWSDDWTEVPKGTAGGFFKETVLSEADINFSCEIYYVTDVYTVLDSLAQIGVLVIATIVVVNATPAVVANLQVLASYVKLYGIKYGFAIFSKFGANMPNGLISLIQADLIDGDFSIDDMTILITTDLQDGDTIADDIIYYISADASDGDLLFDDIIAGSYDNLYSLYQKTYRTLGIQCHHLIEKRFIYVFAQCKPDLTTGQMLSILLNTSTHKMISQLWRTALPYGTTYTLDEVIKAAQEVYKEYPRILELVENWLKAIGAMK